MIYSLVALGLSLAAGACLTFYYRWRLAQATNQVTELRRDTADLGANRDAIAKAMSDLRARLEAENASLNSELDLTRDHLLDVVQKLAIKDPGSAGDFLDGVLDAIAKSNARRAAAAVPAGASAGASLGRPPR